MHRKINAAAGSHVFLRIPAVRWFQTHPFTLTSTSPAEFVIKAHDGFTRSLHELALKQTKTKYRAAIEGPYGNVPSVENYDDVVLIAGGSGASFTFALAMDWVKKYANVDSSKSLTFVWAIKDKGAFIIRFA
jgi:predicted ferric reductase